MVDPSPADVGSRDLCFGLVPNTGLFGLWVGEWQEGGDNGE